MAALISVFIAITLSLLITRVARALTLTGLSRATASFQARSTVLATAHKLQRLGRKPLWDFASIEAVGCTACG